MDPVSKVHMCKKKIKISSTAVSQAIISSTSSSNSGKLHPIGKDDYSKALAASKREMMRLRVFSIEGMEAHDFAVEAVLLSQRWGGSSFVSRRAKLLVLERFRFETGARLVSKNRPRLLQCDRFNFAAKPEISHAHEDLEELLSTLSIPERMKDIIRCKVHMNMKNFEIAKRLELEPASISQYIGEWSHAVTRMLNQRSESSGVFYTKNIRPRATKRYVLKTKKKEAVLLAV
jgi:hypothetical protein